MGIETGVLIALSATAAGVGGYMQYQGQKQQADVQKSMMEYEADRRLRDAEYKRLASREMQQTRRDKLRKILSSQRAAYAKGGVTMAGSPTEVQLQTVTDIETDIAMAAWDFEVGARHDESAAALSVFRAGAARQAGKIGANTALVGMAGSMASLGASYKLQSMGTTAKTPNTAKATYLRY